MVGSDNNKQNVRFFIFVVADKQNCTNEVRNKYDNMLLMSKIMKICVMTL